MTSPPPPGFDPGIPPLDPPVVDSTSTPVLRTIRSFFGQSEQSQAGPSTNPATAIPKRKRKKAEDPAISGAGNGSGVAQGKLVINLSTGTGWSVARGEGDAKPVSRRKGREVDVGEDAEFREMSRRMREAEREKNEGKRRGRKKQAGDIDDDVARQGGILLTISI
jgi:hypothetical protein